VTDVDTDETITLPAAVEPHAHLDKAFLADVVTNETGDLLGAIEAMAAARDRLGFDETVARAERAARTMAANGYVAVRSHADVTATRGPVLGSGLTNVEALAEVRRRVAGLIDVQIVALAGHPVAGPAGADQRTLLVDALSAGADLVGGCPHLEPDGVAAATDALMSIAADQGAGVDLHTDETLDPAADGLSELADFVLRTGFELPVTASHCVSLAMRPEVDQRRIAERVAAAGIGVVALPATNLYLQGRAHQTAMPRGLTAVRALREAGVAVAAGADNVQDPFNPLGRLSPFETAALMVLTAHLLPADAWATVSTRAAAVIGRPLGEADVIDVGAGSVREAIATGGVAVAVRRAGQLQ
jgi:cytosine deaminase